MRRGSLCRYQTSFALSAYGVRVAVRVTEADAFEKLRPYLPVGSKLVQNRGASRIYSIETVDSPVSAYRLYRDRKHIIRSAEEQLVLDAFESDITVHVAELARRRVFVHAGVVAWRGRAIVIPGRSFTGKTTLVSELVRAGAVYYSDEYAIFDRHGRVHPYPRALHIRKDGESRQTKCAPENLGADTGNKSLPLGLVVVTRYRKGAHWRPRQISAGRAVLELLNNTVSARRDPEAALSSFQCAVRQAKFLRGVRGNAAETAASILHQIS